MDLGSIVYVSTRNIIEVQRRQQAPRPSHPERDEVDRAGLLALGHQQQRDQVAADDEEHLDAEEPAAEPPVVGVVDDHRDDRERAHAVEPGQVRHLAQVRVARRGREGASMASAITTSIAGPARFGWSIVPRTLMPVDRRHRGRVPSSAAVEVDAT